MVKRRPHTLLRNLVPVVVFLACTTGSIVAAQDDAEGETEQIPPQVLEELKAPVVDCPADLGEGWLCGQYKSGFSRLKFELEVELDLQRFKARSLTLNPGFSSILLMTTITGALPPKPLTCLSQYSRLLSFRQS